MFEYFNSPYAIAIITALLTAALLAAHARFADPDEKPTPMRTFFKAALAGIIAGTAFAFVVNRPESTLNEPFEAGNVPGF